VGFELLLRVALDCVQLTHFKLLMQLKVSCVDGTARGQVA